MDDREFERARDVYQRISAPKELREKVLRQAASSASAEEAGGIPDVKSQSESGSRSGGGFGSRWKKTYYGGALAACLAVFVFLWGFVPAGEADMASAVLDGDETKNSVVSLKNGQEAESDEAQAAEQADPGQEQANPGLKQGDLAQDLAKGRSGTGQTDDGGNQQNSAPVGRAAETVNAGTADAAPVDAKASKPAAGRAADPVETVRDGQNGMTQGSAEGLISGQDAQETGEGTFGKAAQSEEPCDETCQEPCNKKPTAQAMESSEGSRRGFDKAGLIHRRQYFDDTWTIQRQEDGRTKTEHRGEDDK